ncbi:hypothetical protein TWF281_010563 [Arthrobotrys megalospora]
MGAAMSALDPLLAVLSGRNVYKGFQSGFCFDGAHSQRPDWMRHIWDGRSIAEITIPGTHESMTYRGLHVKGVGWRVDDPVFGQCQCNGLRDQLLSGIRYIDIRVRAVNNTLRVVHDFEQTDFTFDDVFRECKRFLDEYRSECIIMRIREEGDPIHSSRGVGDFLHSDYINNSENKGYFSHYTNRMPSIGSIRGKIQILQGFTHDDALGITWNGDLMSIEDHWQNNSIFRIEDRWDYARTQINNKRAGNMHGVLSLAHLSANEAPEGPPIAFAAGGPAPLFPWIPNGHGTNYYLTQYILRSYDFKAAEQCLGIVIMDFPGKVPINLLVACARHQDPTEIPWEDFGVTKDDWEKYLNGIFEYYGHKMGF